MLIFFFQDSSEVIALQDKLSQSNNKLAEFRNQCEKLKKDLKVAHKVLLKHGQFKAYCSVRYGGRAFVTSSRF